MTDLTAYTMEERLEAINQVIDNERDRLVLTMRFIDKHSYAEIGEVVHLCDRQVGHILFDGSAKVGDYLLKKKKKRRRFLFFSF